MIDEAACGMVLSVLYQSFDPSECLAIRLLQMTIVIVTLIVIIANAIANAVTVTNTAAATATAGAIGTIR